MAIHDDLGTRMKEFYEQVPKTRLVRRMPVAVRVDGRAFHTFTKGFTRPFDEVLVATMQNTMKYLCQNIQGCVLGYTQSDEITLILVDYHTLTSEAFFNYEIQKMCSIIASMATVAFNKYFCEVVEYWHDQHFPTNYLGHQNEPYDEGLMKRYETYNKAANKGAMFDCRVFNIPKEEVTNLIYWRQLDASRNSIQMVGQANFSHKELQGKSCNNIQDMLMTEKGINWNDYPTYVKRGNCCVRMPGEVKIGIGPDGREVCCRDWLWNIDLEIPIFKGEGRKYIDELVFIGDE